MHAKLHRRERGASAMTVALVLMVLGGFLALVLNVGHVMTVRNELQNAVDAAALAGAMELDGETTHMGPLRLASTEIAAEHRTDRLAVLLDANAGNAAGGDIVVGTWDFDEPDKWLAFTPATAATSVRDLNAVLVRAGRERARGNALPVFFSAFLDRNEVSVGAEAVAVHGGPCDACVIPIAFADCLIVKPDNTIDCGKILRFTEATVDNIGFTNLDPTSRAVNTSGLVDLFNEDCHTLGAGVEIGIGNGNNMTPSVIAAFTEMLERRGSRVTAPIIDPPTCPDPQFNQMQPVVGFATFTVLEVNGPPTQPKREIVIQLDCVEMDGQPPAPSGCGNFGTTTPNCTLVR